VAAKERLAFLCSGEKHFSMFLGIIKKHVTSCYVCSKIKTTICLKYFSLISGFSSF